MSAYRLAACLSIVFCALICNVAHAAKEDTKLVIPDYPYAKDQFNFATMYEQSQFMSPDLEKRKAQIQKVSQCYQRVIDNFPQDTEFTPRAILQLGDCQAKISKPDEALKYYNVIINSGSSDEYLQARALFSIGQMLDMKKDYASAKSVYKEVMERYGTSTSAAIREMTKKASQLYFQVHEQPAQKKKWSIPKLFGRKDS